MPCHSDRRLRLLLPVMSMSKSQARAGEARNDGGEVAYLLPLSDDKQSAISLRARHTTIAARPIARSSSMTRVYLGNTRPSPAMASSTMCATPAALNGTFVNGRRLLADTATRLHAGDELRFADLQFRFISGPAS